jgi:hypothetical protein
MCVSKREMMSSRFFHMVSEPGAKGDGGGEP